ncbi:ABC transporter substrate-binding protein [Candidatus Nitrosocosmicus hydrocola]|uniref:ABC transporter substrate-binding protein n=1 Tax=Candidatus Nitrosocosmicus hydrocola TaxID=1826872 RepID=UPI0011E5B0C9|nr:ABC transporter substrate-binding protein [Candidatus Nitrosocosmicus hydrocola]
MRPELKLTISGIIIISVIVSSNHNLHFPLLLGNNGLVDEIRIHNTDTKDDFLRIGYFLNLNHAPAIIQQVNDKHYLNNITISSSYYTSERSIIEALYEEKIDVAYVNPSTIIDSYILLGNQDFRIISGLSSGGVSFVLRNDSGIESVSDLGDKTFAFLQSGNTQDVALRNYLTNNGFDTVGNGGNVTVMGLKLVDIIAQFQNKKIDGAWVPEPIPTILMQESNGKIFVDERSLWPDGQFVTGNIIVRTNYLTENPDIIKSFLKTHLDEINWINSKLVNTNNTKVDRWDESEIVSAFIDGLKNITGKTYPDNQLANALSRMEFTSDPLSDSLRKIIEDAQDLGLIIMGSNWNLEFDKIYDLTLLDEVLNGNRTQ